MLTRAEQNLPLPVYGTGENVRDWLYVQGHCRAIDAILRRGSMGEVYNIGGHHKLRNIDLVNNDLPHTGKPEALITFVGDRKGHDRRYAIDAGKTHRELDWTPQVSFEQGLRDTLEWYQAHRDWWENTLRGEYQAYYHRMYDAQ